MVADLPLDAPRPPDPGRAARAHASSAAAGCAASGRLALLTIAFAAPILFPSVAQAQDVQDPDAEGMELGAIAPEGGVRMHSSGSFAVGAVGEGFGAGFAGTFGWDLSDPVGMEFSFGLGGTQGRGGGAVGGLYTHIEGTLPITFNVCASIPRVCPALDFEISVVPGLGYAYLDGLHSGNVILGFAVASLRKTQDMDVGVRTAVVTYLDILNAALDGSADRLLAMVTLQLGFIIRWGVIQP